MSDVPLELARLTWPEVRALAEDGRAVAILATGSCEQHGPHLPTITDTALAQELARRVARRIADPVLICPPFPFGLSDHHAAFPGTITVTEAVFGAVLDSQVAALRRAGVERVAIFSAHGGNFAALGRFAAGAGPRVTAYSDLERFIEVMFAAGVAAGLDPPETDVHAGQLETSMCLALPGHRVRPFDDVPGYAEAEDGWLRRMTDEGIGALSPTGVLGTPRGATAEAGEAILEALADELASWIEKDLGVQLSHQHTTNAKD